MTTHRRSWESRPPRNAVPAHDEQTVIIESGRPRPTYDDGSRWPDSFRSAGSVSTGLAFDARPVRRQVIQPVVAAAAVAGTALVLIAGSLLWRSGESGSAAAATVDGVAQKRLTALLPAGYSAGACTPTEVPKGAVAAVNCVKNADAGGPLSATYTLMKDAAALSSAVGAAIAAADLVDCPGSIQSPGPWRRNASPQQIAGTLVCGLSQEQPQVTWTNDAELVLNVVRAGPEGPTLDQLYAWWSNHS
jgi:serine/threonine kinase PknH